MSKYDRYVIKKQSRPAYRVHPIWRGVGFLLILLVPFLSYVASLQLIQENERRGWFPIPAELVSPVGDPYLILQVIITISLSFLVYILFLLIYFVIYRVFGPDRYGPTDAPPIQGKIRKRWD